MKVINCWLLILTMMVGVYGQSISDVSTSDATFPAIQKSIKKGYFTLVSGSKFLPNQSVTRAELALILNRLDALSSKAELSATDITELKDFSTSFKRYLTDTQQSSTQIGSDIGLVKTEQKTINYDISRVQDSLTRQESNNKNQDILIWSALGLGIIGLLN